jgi:hypothetical protein
MLIISSPSSTQTRLSALPTFDGPKAASAAKPRPGFLNWAVPTSTETARQGSGWGADPRQPPARDSLRPATLTGLPFLATIQWSPLLLPAGDSVLLEMRNTADS